MKKTFSQSFKSFFIEPQWVKVRGIFWFCIITTIIHIVWRLWATTLNFYPVPGLINSTQRFLVYHLFNESAFIISHILKLKISAIGNSIIMENNVGLIFSISASGLKQMIQFVLLILIFRGPWKQKAWFIPAGIIIVHLTNVFRILCLAIIALHWPEQFHYAHDNWMRILFYVVIFGLWLIWVEKISIIKAKT
jgi:exosortase/archaeosortase family protein